MSNRDPSPVGLRVPRLTKLNLDDLTEGQPADLQADADRQGEQFSHVDLSDRDLADARFSECVFADVTLHQTQLRGARFSDTRLEGLNAPVLLAARSTWRGVAIEHSRIGSGELFDSTWESVLVTGCKLGYLNLRGARLRDVQFVDCSIEELDLGGARATRVAFSGSTVHTLDVTQATLEHTDLRGAEFRAVRGMSGLRGATVSAEQLMDLAPFFAAQLGISVE